MASRHPVVCHFLVCFLIVIPSWVPIFGQERSSEATVLRVSTYSMVVDVVVTDKQNRHVTDLTGDDFLIFEDGILQKIESFQSILRATREGTIPASDLPDRAEPHFLLSQTFTLDEGRTNRTEVQLKFPRAVL